MKEKYPKHFFWKAVDGKDYEAVEQFIKEVHDSEGRIDALINNAGMAIDGVLTLMKPDDITSLLSLNLESCIRAARMCAKYMLMQQNGVIINISSIIGIRGYSGLAVYSATKAGLDGLTRGLARELGGRGIRVNSVSPGYLETEMSSTLGDTQRQQIIRRTPLGRLGKTDDVTGVVSFLVSEKARFITGQTIVIDGGITC
jgi:3-oxoacyl-[acyl-carrier protein] reductase